MWHEESYIIDCYGDEMFINRYDFMDICKNSDSTPEKDITVVCKESDEIVNDVNGNEEIITNKKVIGIKTKYILHVDNIEIQ